LNLTPLSLKIKIRIRAMKSTARSRYFMTWSPIPIRLAIRTKKAFSRIEIRKLVTNISHQPLLTQEL